jgi:hypothetical protein
MGFREASSDLLERSGLAIPACRRSLWVHGETPLQFEGARQLIQASMAERPHVRLVLTSRSMRTLRFLRATFTDDQTLAAPFDAAPIVRRFLHRLQVRHILLLDGGRSVPSSALRLAPSRQITLSVVNIGNPDVLDPAVLEYIRRHPDAARLCVYDESVSLRLRGMGVQAASIAVTGCPDLDDRRGAPSPTSSERTYGAIADLLPGSPNLPRVAQDWRVPTLRDKAGASGLWRQASRPLTRNRIDRWKDLRESMGNPRSVLCLGNGPSSEDPRLSSFEHECLIRVNWRWKLRGFLDRPHIVFVGDPSTVHKVDSAIFGFWNTPLEYGMLLRRLITRGPVPMRYFTMDRISPIVRDQTWPARPTNGALMIAAGAALAPERLIIAGVDLYLHPEGRYPGDLQGNNQYAHAHSRDTDLAIIRAALAQYSGELIILSELLRSALDEGAEEVSLAGD